MKCIRYSSPDASSFCVREISLACSLCHVQIVYFFLSLQLPRARRTAINKDMEIYYCSALHLMFMLWQSGFQHKGFIYGLPARSQSRRGLAASYCLHGNNMQACSCSFSFTLFVFRGISGITFHPAEAKEHPGPRGTDTAAGSGQRRKDHAAETVGFGGHQPHHPHAGEEDTATHLLIRRARQYFYFAI